MEASIFIGSMKGSLLNTYLFSFNLSIFFNSYIIYFIFHFGIRLLQYLSVEPLFKTLNFYNNCWTKRRKTGDNLLVKEKHDWMGKNATYTKSEMETT